MTNKREAILEATLHLLASKGLHGFSIKQVAELAGVAAGTVYLYFHDRDDLIQQLHLKVLERVASHLFAYHQPTQPLFKQYRQFCLSLWQLFLAEPDILLSKSQFDHMPPDVLHNQHASAKVTFLPLITFFSRGRDEGVMKDLPDDFLFALSFGPYFDLVRKHMVGLISVDEAMQEKMIVASWDAIVLPRTDAGSLTQ